MKFKPGDKILVVIDLSDPTTIREYTVSKVGKDTVQCGSSELTFYTAFCWPISYKERLIEIIKERARLKAIYDDSIMLIYKLRNELSSGATK